MCDLYHNFSVSPTLLTKVAQKKCYHNMCDLFHNLFSFTNKVPFIGPENNNKPA